MVSFTSSVLTLVARANGKISWKALFKNWAVVYGSNLVGAVLLVICMLDAHVRQGEVGINAMHIAQHKLHLTSSRRLLWALCNVLVCIAV